MTTWEGPPLASVEGTTLTNGEVVDTTVVALPTE